MSELFDVAARLVARQTQRAVPTRTTSSLSQDPDLVFAIAPIRIVSEQQVQAIAFGHLPEPPQIVTRWNPLSRESGDLEPFAVSLDAYLSAMLEAGTLPRIWLPHAAALEIIELLGHRYRTNRIASETLRRMGAQCLEIAEEARFPGQQVVAVASDALSAHVATGQSPKEDHHLGALLAWIDPAPGTDVVEKSRRCALVPAAAMLERKLDDRVERLRRDGKGKDAAAVHARLEIHHLLVEGALREWELLEEARHAFIGLRLRPNPNLGPLVQGSMKRFSYAIEQARNPRSQPVALSRLLEDLEAAGEFSEDASIRGDGVIREIARRQGRVFSAKVVHVDQPKRNCHPCTLTLTTHQEVLRIRRGTRLRTIDGELVGVVKRVWDSGGSGATNVELKITKGVRGVANRARMAVGSAEDWCDSVAEDRSKFASRIRKAVREGGSPLVYADSLPPAAPRRVPVADLVSLADSLRRS